MRTPSGPFWMPVPVSASEVSGSELSVDDRLIRDHQEAAGGELSAGFVGQIGVMVGTVDQLEAVVGKIDRGPDPGLRISMNSAASLLPD